MISINPAFHLVLRLLSLRRLSSYPSPSIRSLSSRAQPEPRLDQPSLIPPLAPDRPSIDQPHKFHPHHFNPSSNPIRPVDTPPKSTINQDVSNIHSTQPQPSTSTLKLPSTYARNQLIPVSTTLSNDLHSILHSFKPPIRYAFAYGSAVFPQKSHPSSQNSMLDFIFAVSHPSHWHSINLQHNPHHYSLPARIGGSSTVSWLQEHGPGAEIWFNVEAIVHDRVIKYGVISIDSLCNDLLDWNTLYVSGRMHKPVHILRDDPRVRLAQQVNLASSLRTALLLLPEKFDEPTLFRTIAGLSYTGDVRMRWAENPLKVKNIVDRQLDLFRTLYHPLLNALKSHIYPLDIPDQAFKIFLQDSSPRAKAELLNKLPIKLKDMIHTVYDRRWKLQLAIDQQSSSQRSEQFTSTDQLEIMTRIVSDSGFQDCLRRSLVDIVHRPSFHQSLKGLFSAGPIKSLRYASSKVSKRFNLS